MGRSKRNKYRQHVYQSGSRYASAPETPNTFMDPNENQFYHQLNRIVKLQQAWLDKCKAHRDHIASKYVWNPAEDIFRHNQERAAYVKEVERTLMDAGRILGYNPRFIVSIDEFEKLHIQPKNGSAGRMMQRWDDLEAMFELGRD